MTDGLTIPLFDNLPEDDRATLLRSATSRTCTDGEAVINEGDPGEGLFIISAGEMLIEKATIEGKAEVLSVLSAGECFGELALVDHGPRSATVRARGDAEVLAFEADSLDSFFALHVEAHRSILKNLAVIPSGRLRRLDEAVIESAYDSVLLIDSDFRILKHRRITERAPLIPTVSGKGTDLFEAVPRLGEGVRQNLSILIQADQLARMSLEYENDDGETHYFELTVAPGGDGGASIGIRNVTETRALETRLIQSEKLAMTGQMSAEIGHELRNFLTVLIGHVDLLAINPDIQGSEKGKRSVGIIGEQLERVEKFASGLMEMGQLKLKKEPSHVNLLIEKLISFIQGQRRFRQVEFELDLGEGVPLIEADPGQLQQVLLNLFPNSADAMGAGIVEVRTALNDDRDLVVSVRDTGPGMPDEVVARIFETGFTTKDTGHGFGLPVCRRIVENHSGVIEVETEPGVGSTFTLTFSMGDEAE